MKLTRHPRRRRLRRWLDGAGSERVTRHIEQCARCQEELEALSALDAAVVEELDAALTVPDDVSRRTREALESRLRSEAALGVFVDLFGVAGDLVRLVVDDTPLAGPGDGGAATHGDDAQADTPTTDGEDAQADTPTTDGEQR
ncbi:MAG: hypothetical protein D6683_13760 [Actinomyces sp.]|nr:MAG: hypothetical protein D6683_13760 [Actinomyces sp.]